MHNPFVVILLAGVAGYLFGAVWYITLGGPWKTALGLSPEQCKDHKPAVLPMVAAFLGAVVMSAVLYQLLTNLGVMGVSHGAIAGLTIGIGFLLTSTIVNNLFAGRPWMLTLIDGGHWVLAVVIESAVIMSLA